VACGRKTSQIKKSAMPVHPRASLFRAATLACRAVQWPTSQLTFVLGRWLRPIGFMQDVVHRLKRGADI